MGHPSMNQTNLSPWQALWRDLGAQGDPAPWHQRLVAAYVEPSRHYHNLRHLEECLTELYAADSRARQLAVVAMALWFHDAVYDAKSPSNEADSAQLATDCLTAAGVKSTIVGTVQRLILCTQTHEPGVDPDAALLIDIDLAILGQPSERFLDYERGIRAEYAWVPWPTFAQKRAEILGRFLKRPAIYRTESFARKYEAPARVNLQAAIHRLLSAPP